jgi:hypothetical protein
MEFGHMKTIKPFIDAGWWTVPLTGELKRLPDGSKTIPNFQKDWKDRYNEERNLTSTKLGGVITGTKSNIIAIDCDNAAVYSLFRSLDPDYAGVFVSRGKKEDAGTVIYSYTDGVPPNFGIKNDSIELDFYGEHGFVYLPTENNESKETWAAVQEIKEAPDTVKTLLAQLYSLYQNKQVVVVAAVTADKPASYLAPTIQEFVHKNAFMPGLFKIITPKSFRTEAEYVKCGYLHPNNVPAGRGSEYLSRISAIFGADPSVDEELYVSAMHAINNLFDDPMDKSRLDKTICDPMIEQKVSIDGSCVWHYDKHWTDSRLVMRTKRQTSLEIAYDDRRRVFYTIDVPNERVETFDTDNALQMHLDTVLASPIAKKELKVKMPIINVVSNPSEEFGFLGSDDSTVRDFNSFVATPELRIINNPDLYADMYQEPTTILRYLETLVPEDEMRDYLLGFLKTKFTTFKYSPAVLYFLGAHGSGKDTLVEILERIMGSMARPKAKEFIEKHNGWILDNYFAQLDEYGNQLTRQSEQDEAVGIIKAISGKPKISIRMMRSDGYDYMHHLTLILSANKNPLPIEDGDRRFVFLHTPNVLAETDWVTSAGGMVHVRDKLMAEIKDFCYYLATKVPDLPMDSYMKPPYSKHKHRIIADNMYAAARIAYAFKHGMQDYLIDLANEYEDIKAVEAFKKGQVTTADLESLYDEMTDYKGDMRALNKALRSSGVGFIPTTINGEKAYRYKLNWAKESPFGEEDES